MGPSSGRRGSESLRADHSSREDSHELLSTSWTVLQGGDPALESIEIVVSPFRQKNMYTIGHIACFEGYKKVSAQVTG